MQSHTNRLIHETSPYLLQHAHNPVDWYPWNPDALAKARRDDKPILLSIGYSACHWCHVMEHESFEDEEVARVMNEHFVCIKVDREERPDLDKVYQTAHQVLSQRSGGWPLTVFLTPDDLMPFFAGTYFPKTARYGMPGFVDLLPRVAAAYREQREAIQAQNDSLRGVFARIEAADTDAPVELSPRLLQQARTELQSQFDADHGGFGGAPKFPHPTSLQLLLREATATGGNGQSSEREMVRRTLTAMARGGLYDQLGGGFYRYSVDERWEIPHFEKMLYDNAQLLPLYADAALLLEEPLFRRVAEDTGGWVLREMQAPEGGYYSTLDADSEGHEGKYYVWEVGEVRAALTADEYAAAERRFGLDASPNFEGKWHFNVRADVDDIARDLQLPADVVHARLEGARAKLFAMREQRVRPGRDDKILASWNGLMIKGMARAGRLLDLPALVDSAGGALDFVRRTLWRDGCLLATAKDQRAHLNAYLDDHVFLIDATLELLQARWRTEEFHFALALARTVLERFQDAAEGGFYFTSHDHEKLVHRPKPSADEALPSGNGVAAQSLLHLGYLLGDGDFLSAAERALTAHYPRIAQHPSAHCSLLLALRDYLQPTRTLILRGAPELLRRWQDKLAPRHAGRLLTFAIPADAAGLPDGLAARRHIADVTAYLCHGHTCAAPVTRFEELAGLLHETA